MEYLLDDPVSEQIFQDILRRIRALKNGEVVDSMQKRGIHYKVNLGASVVSLRELASNYKKNHLVALKLWNKQWRETMIMATLLEDPQVVTAHQMEFWVRQITTVEMAEQLAMNLLVYTPDAFSLAEEFCLGRKLLSKITGLLLMARLAMVDKGTPDEKFETLFELLPPLSKDPQLSMVFVRVFVQMAMRNKALYTVAIQHATLLKTLDSEVAHSSASEILAQLEDESVLAIVESRTNI